MSYNICLKGFILSDVSYILYHMSCMLYYSPSKSQLEAVPLVTSSIVTSLISNQSNTYWSIIKQSNVGVLNSKWSSRKCCSSNYTNRKQSNSNYSNSHSSNINQCNSCWYNINLFNLYQSNRNDPIITCLVLLGPIINNSLNTCSIATNLIIACLIVTDRIVYG